MLLLVVFMHFVELVFGEVFRHCLVTLVAFVLFVGAFVQFVRVFIIMVRAFELFFKLEGVIWEAYF